jgi:hypothetical protein
MLDVENSENENEVDDEEEKIRAHLLTIPIVWSKDAEQKNSRTIKGIPKTTYYRKFGTSGTLANAAKKTHQITNFFGTISEVSGGSASSLVSSSGPMRVSNSSVQADKNDIETASIIALHNKITQLREDLLKNVQVFTAFEYNERRAVYEYFIRIDDGNGKMKASEEAAHMVYISPRPYTAKRIRSLAKHYLEYNSFPISR